MRGVSGANMGLYLGPVLSVDSKCLKEELVLLYLPFSCIFLLGFLGIVRNLTIDLRKVKVFPLGIISPILSCIRGIFRAELYEGGRVWYACL